MRSLWCTLIAVCFLAGGVRPMHAERTRGDASTLRVAAGTHAASLRRASSDLGPVIAPDAPHVTAVRERVSDVVLRAPVSLELRLALSPRSSRGPPHA